MSIEPHISTGGSPLNDWPPVLVKDDEIFLKISLQETMYMFGNRCFSFLIILLEMCFSDLLVSLKWQRWQSLVASRISKIIVVDLI